jgi:hypothetical protein
MVGNYRITLNAIELPKSGLTIPGRVKIRVARHPEQREYWLATVIGQPFKTIGVTVEAAYDNLIASIETELFENGPVHLAVGGTQVERLQIRRQAWVAQLAAKLPLMAADRTPNAP